MKKYKPNIIFFISIFMSILIHLILIEKIDLGSFIKNSNDTNKEVEIEINIQENQLNQKSPKKIYTKDNMQKVKNSKKITENNVTEKSFVYKFLSSVKQKMYGNR